MASLPKQRVKITVVMKDLNNFYGPKCNVDFVDPNQDLIVDTCISLNTSSTMCLKMKPGRKLK